MTDGPFTEAEEVIGGYWMIQVKSRQEVDRMVRCAAPPRTEFRTDAD